MKREEILVMSFRDINRELRQRRRRRRQQERQKTIGSEIGKTTTSLRSRRLEVVGTRKNGRARRISLPSVHDYDVKVPNFTFCRERDARRLPFSFSELRYSPLELNSRKIRTHLTN